jgi:hypothetical protein
LANELNAPKKGEERARNMDTLMQKIKLETVTNGEIDERKIREEE